jgi:hypothetical protein
VHSAFWLSSLELSIGIVSTGRVGSALLHTLLANLTMLESRLDWLIAHAYRPKLNRSLGLCGD